MTTFTPGFPSMTDSEFEKVHTTNLNTLFLIKDIIQRVHELIQDQSSPK